MNRRSLLILNYHQICVARDPENSFSVTAADFAAQMQLLKERDIPVLPLSSWGKSADATPDGFSVALTFDDGNYSDMEHVLPLLKRYGFTAGFFPTINSIGGAGKLSWSDLIYLSEQGFSVGSHGLSHRSFAELSVSQQIRELKGSKQLLEDRLQTPVPHFALPYGVYSRTTLKIAEYAGYHRILTTGLRINTRAEKLMLSRWNLRNDTSLNRFDKIIRSNGSLDTVTRLSNGLKQQAKRWFGHRPSHYLNELI